LALGRETEVGRSICIRLEAAGDYVLMFVTAEFQGPTGLPSLSDQRRKDGIKISSSLQLVPLYLFAFGIEPNFKPIIARHFDHAFRLHRLFVGIERFKRHSDLVLRP